MNIRTILKNTFYRVMPRKVCISHIYKKVIGKNLQWNSPKTLNEKIQWLKLYSDTSLWTRCADKYLVRKYVEEHGLAEALVPLYGVYKSANEIDFSKLPKSFVLKVNNGSGDAIIVRDKGSIDETMTKEQLQKDLNRKFGLNQTEYHYLQIPPRIVCEKLLVDSSRPNEAILDYKIWCFNGKPHSIFAISNRTKDSFQMYLYDLNWNPIGDGKLNYSSHHRKGTSELPRPVSLNKMIEYARILSKDIPQVRVDFYEIDGKIYFGEMTFTSNGGYMKYFTPEYLLEMGNLFKLPAKR